VGSIYPVLENGWIAPVTLSSAQALDTKTNNPASIW